MPSDKPFFSKQNFKIILAVTAAVSCSFYFISVFYQPFAGLERHNKSTKNNQLEDRNDSSIETTIGTSSDLLLSKHLHNAEGESLCLPGGINISSSLYLTITPADDTTRSTFLDYYPGKTEVIIMLVNLLDFQRMASSATHSSQGQNCILTNTMGLPDGNYSTYFTQAIDEENFSAHGNNTAYATNYVVMNQRDVPVTVSFGTSNFSVHTEIENDSKLMTEMMTSRDLKKVVEDNVLVASNQVSGYINTSIDLLSGDGLIKLACLDGTTGEIATCEALLLLSSESKKHALPFWSSIVASCILLLSGVFFQYAKDNVSPRVFEVLESTLFGLDYRILVEVYYLLATSLFILGVIQVNFTAGYVVITVISVIIPCFFRVKKEVKNDKIIFITAKNSYEDITCSKTKVIILFYGQFLLIIMYAWGLWDAGLPDLSDQRIYGYYCIGIILQLSYVTHKNFFKALTETNAIEQMQNVGIGTLGLKDILIISWSKDFSGDEDDLSQRLEAASGWNFATNYFGLSFIVLGLPLQVARERSPIDFVLNAIAAFYILELDDLNEPKLIAEIYGIEGATKHLEDQFKVVADEFIDWVVTSVMLQTKTKAQVDHDSKMEDSAGVSRKGALLLGSQELKIDVDSLAKTYRSMMRKLLSTLKKNRKLARYKREREKVMQLDDYSETGSFSNSHDSSSANNEMAHTADTREKLILDAMTKLDATFNALKTKLDSLQQMAKDSYDIDDVHVTEKKLRNFLAAMLKEQQNVSKGNDDSTSSDKLTPNNSKVVTNDNQEDNGGSINDNFEKFDDENVGRV